MIFFRRICQSLMWMKKFWRKGRIARWNGTMWWRWMQEGEGQQRMEWRSHTCNTGNQFEIDWRNCWNWTEFAWALFKVAHYHESWRPNDFVIAALNHYDQFSTFHSTLKISSNICCIFIMALFIRRIIFQLICASQTFSYANHFTSYISWAVQIITKPESFRISNLVSLFRFSFFLSFQSWKCWVGLEISEK